MLRLLSLMCLAWTMAACVEAADMVDLKVGDPAPQFTARDDEGQTWKSEDHVGKKIVVVYFYPADCTGGCTKQAQGFRDDMEKLHAKGVEVVGVSGDSPDNHKVFKKLEKLNFTLLADEDGKVAEKFGVPFKRQSADVSVNVDGQPTSLTRGGTAQRWTFVIGRDGRILSKNTTVKAAQDSDAVLQLITDQSKN